MHIIIYTWFLLRLCFLGLFSSSYPTIPHYLWEQFGPFSRIKPLTLIISIIQGGFEEDTRKMRAKYNLQTNMKPYYHRSPHFWWFPFENIEKVSLLLCPPSLPPLSLTPPPSWWKLWAGLSLQILWAHTAVSTLYPSTCAEGDFSVVISEFPFPLRKLCF